MLTAGGHDGETFDMTGPEALTFFQVAEQLSRAAGRQVVYVDETLEEARASRSVYGAPEWEVEGWVTSYAAVATGEMDIVSDAVADALRARPTSLDDYLAANPESLDKLRAR